MIRMRINQYSLFCVVVLLHVAVNVIDSAVVSGSVLSTFKADSGIQLSSSTSNSSNETSTAQLQIKQIVVVNNQTTLAPSAPLANAGVLPGSSSSNSAVVLDDVLDASDDDNNTVIPLEDETVSETAAGLQENDTAGDTQFDYADDEAAESDQEPDAQTAESDQEPDAQTELDNVDDSSVEASFDDVQALGDSNDELLIDSDAAAINAQEDTEDLGFSAESDESNDEDTVGDELVATEDLDEEEDGVQLDLEDPTIQADPSWSDSFTGVEP